MIIEQQIRLEIYRAFNLLGADHKLLGTVGSWGTLDDKEILRLLKEWNTDEEMRAAVEALQRIRPKHEADRRQRRNVGKLLAFLQGVDSGA